MSNHIAHTAVGVSQHACNSKGPATMPSNYESGDAPFSSKGASTQPQQTIRLKPATRLESSWVEQVRSGERQVRTLADRVVLCRLMFGKTQEEIAEQIWIVPNSGPKRGVRRHLRRNSYAQYELGDVEPPLNVIAQLATLFGVLPGWLAFGDENGGN